MEELVNDAADGILVSRDGGSRDDHAVPAVNLNLLVFCKRHPVQRGHCFALTACGYNHRTVFRLGFDLFQIHQDALRNVHIPQDHGCPKDIFHAASRHGYLAVILGRNIDNLLQAMDIGGKRGDDNPLVAVQKQLVKALPHLALRRGMSRSLHVG